jgi:hypothetical protein
VSAAIESRTPKGFLRTQTCNAADDADGGGKIVPSDTTISVRQCLPMPPLISPTGFLAFHEERRWFNA